MQYSRAKHVVKCGIFERIVFITLSFLLYN